MKTLITILFLVLTSQSLMIAKAQSGAEEAWNAGSILFKVHTSQGVKEGQGYMAVKDGNLWIHTIHHVIKDAIKVEIHISGLWADGDFQEIDLDRFNCESERLYDDDPSCSFAVKEPLATDVLGGKHPLIPYVRVMPSDIIGEYVGIPLPENPTQWAIYSVTGYDKEQITIKSVGMGSLCQGNSGSPLALLKRRGSVFEAVTKNDFPISIGDLEAGTDGYADPRGRNRSCFLHMIANRPEGQGQESVYFKVSIVYVE